MAYDERRCRNGKKYYVKNHKTVLAQVDRPNNGDVGLKKHFSEGDWSLQRDYTRHLLNFLAGVFPRVRRYSGR